MDSLVLISLGAGADVLPLASASAYAARRSGSAATSAAAPFSAPPSISSACWLRKIARGGAAVPLADRLLSIHPLSAPSRSTRGTYSCGAAAPVLPAVSARSSARRGGAGGGGGGGGTIRRAHSATAIVAAQGRRRRAARQILITTPRATSHRPIGGGAALSSSPSSSSSTFSSSSSSSSSSSFSSSFSSARAADAAGCLSGDRWQADEAFAAPRGAAFIDTVRFSRLRGSRIRIDTWQASRGAAVSNFVKHRRRAISGRRPGRESGRSMVMASVAASAETETMPIPADKPVLFDVPVSNNGARVRLVLYIKELEDEVIIKPPAAVGGLKSEAYLALNPLGKMPLLVFPDGTSIFESEVISEYFLDKYSDKGPSFVPHAIELRITSNLAKRILDMYIAGNMGSMYRAMDVESRAKGIAEINQYLDVLEDIITSTPYVAGPEISSGDTALFPNFIFMNYMLPQFFGWDTIFNRRPKLQSWWETMSVLPAGSRVREEIETALNGWKESGRWDKVGVNEHVTDTNYQWKF